ncbi:hypothetical protein ACP6H1_27385 [Vibrio harveyi]|uniref:hypothetical protein n=1 Tax=Vibrio harveyi TaxID=669 RepID=UPI003CF9EDA8
MIFHADMSLRIFRKTFPEIYELEQFPTQLKSLRRNIDNLEKKVDLLPPEATILPPLKNIINELNVLHTVYNSYTTPNTDTLEA